MPSPRRTIRSHRHRGWNDRHFAHLLTGHDWQFMGDQGWGHLTELTPDAIATTVADMAACWHAHRDQITPEQVGVNYDGPAWFEDYVFNPQKLIDEVTAHRTHRRLFPHGGACGCSGCRDLRESGEVCSPDCVDCQQANLSPDAAPSSADPLTN